MTGTGLPGTYAQRLLAAAFIPTRAGSAATRPICGVCDAVRQSSAAHHKRRPQDAEDDRRRLARFRSASQVCQPGLPAPHILGHSFSGCGCNRAAVGSGCALESYCCVPALAAVS